MLRVNINMVVGFADDMFAMICIKGTGYTW